MRKKDFYFKHVLWILLMCCSLSTKAQIYINEMNLCNISKDLDPDYDYKGWIEVYNATAQSVDLKDLYFSDEQGVPQKYKLSASRVIPAGGFGVVWLNDEVANSDGLYLDTDAEGGLLSVANSAGVIQDQIEYPAQFTNVSYGRATDGGSEWAYFIESSCKLSNNGKRTGLERVVVPVLSQLSGFYNDQVRVSITCETPDAVIRYTLDGSEPTSASALYTNTLSFKSTTVLRAKAFKDGFLEGVAANATYMINERQTEMAAIFMVVDDRYLNDDMLGIYCVGTNGRRKEGGNWGDVANYYQNWTRPAYIDYIDENSKTQIAQMVGISISGQATRSYNQKSMKIKSGKKYGKNHFEYMAFPDQPGRRYKSFVLRNGGQHNTNGGYKDAFLQKLLGDLNLDYQDFHPVALYINGKYWGYYNLRDRHNEDFVYASYGLKDHQQYMVNVPSIDNLGSNKAYTATYNTLKSLTGNPEKAAEEYATICSLIDIDNALNYVAAEVYLHNLDWPTNNQMLFRNRDDGGRWRWIINDLDLSFSTYSGDRLKAIINGSESSPYVLFFTYLFKNEIFKQKFIDAASLIMGSCYNKERVESFYAKNLGPYIKERSYQKERWGGVNANDMKNDAANQLKLIASFQDTLMNNMRNYFNLGQVRELEIASNQFDVPMLFNGLDIPVLPFKGKYYENRSLTLSVPQHLNGKIFKFWKVTKNGVTTTAQDTELTLTIQEATQVEVVYTKAETVKRAGFYINEVSAANDIFVDNANKYEDWIEVYNGSAKPLNLAGYYLSDKLNNLVKWKVPASDTLKTYVPAHGHLVIWCSNKADRGVLHAAFKLAKEGGTVYLSKEDAKGDIQIIDSLRYVEHSPYASFGRYPDAGNQLCLLDVPTFEAPNKGLSYKEVSYVEENQMQKGISQIYVTMQKSGKGGFVFNGISYKEGGSVPVSIESGVSVTMKPEDGYSAKSVFLNGREISVADNIYALGQIYDDVDLLVQFERVNLGKIIVGLSEASWSANSTLQVGSETVNNAAIRYSSSYNDLPIYNTESMQVMQQIRNQESLNGALQKYGITEAICKTADVGEANLSGEKYSAKTYKVAWYFAASAKAGVETRRTVLAFKGVPNDRYDIRILGSLGQATSSTDYSCFRYRANLSDVYTPASDIFYNNNQNLIELKNVEVTDNMLVITAWRDPAQIGGYGAPINLVEIVQSEFATDLPEAIGSDTESTYTCVGGVGSIQILGTFDQPLGLYGIDGSLIRTLVPDESMFREIAVPAGYYVVGNQKVVVY